jgi:hypothetical protein
VRREQAKALEVSGMDQNEVRIQRCCGETAGSDEPLDAFLTLPGKEGSFGNENPLGEMAPGVAVGLTPFRWFPRAESHDGLLGLGLQVASTLLPGRLEAHSIRTYLVRMD